jgi:hypothetical protein
MSATGKMSTKNSTQECYMKVEEEIDRIELQWEGVDLSLNKWYANRHWSFRNKEKEFWANLFLKLLPKRTKKIDKYMITLYFNSRLDASNTVPMIKILEDTMKKSHYIIDDSKRYCKGIRIYPDETLGKKNYILIFHIITYATKESKTYRP